MARGPGEGANPLAGEPLDTMAFLVGLGFVAGETGGGPGLIYRAGSLDLSAIQAMNRHFVEIVSVRGLHVGARRTSEITMELPVRLDSRAHGLALVAWLLGKRQLPADDLPAWVAEGMAYVPFLPWERERAAYAARPRCGANRTWLRVALKALAEWLASAPPSGQVIFGFGGGVLTIRAGDQVWPVQAAGVAWPVQYAVEAAALAPLPPRLSGPVVEVSVHGGALVIDRYRYGGVVEMAAAAAEAGRAGTKEDA